MGGWNETCLTKLAAWMNGWNHVLEGGETYVWGCARTGNLDTWGATLVKEDVEETDEADEQDEKTDSLSELVLPREVECWGNGSSQEGGE